MKPETLSILEKEFAQFPEMVAGPVDAQEIGNLEKAVGFPLAEDYKLFVSRFGGAIVGPFRIFGLRASTAMGRHESSALETTRRFRDDEWEGVGDWLVISMDHSGNPVGLDRDGRIWISDHDAGAVQQLALTFEDYLRRWCLSIDPIS